jgi:hypothetical protein
MTLFNLFWSLFSSRRDRGTGRGRNRSRAHLAIESLEDRQLLSTFLPETSNAGPAIITFQDQVTGTWAPYIAWTGTDPQHHLNIENLYTGAKVTLPETSTGAPALAVYRGRLFIGWTGTDPQNHLNVESSADGLNFSDKTVLGQTTIAYDGPVLAVHNNDLVIGWTGTDLRLNYAYSFDTFGQDWTPAITLPYQSGYRPTLSTINGDFAISWTDLGDYRYRTWSITYQYEEPDGDLFNWGAPSESVDDGFPPNSYLGIARTDHTTFNVAVFSLEFGFDEINVGQSYWGPSLAVDEIPDYEHFYVAWTGLDHQLYYDVLPDGASYQGAASQHGPALAGLSGRLDAARTGADNRLSALDPVNGVRPSGGPVNVAGQGAPGPAADGDLYLARAGRGDQTRAGDVNNKTARSTGGSGHNGGGLAVDIAGTPGIGGAGTGDGSGPFGGGLNDEAV